MEGALDFSSDLSDKRPLDLQAAVCAYENLLNEVEAGKARSTDKLLELLMARTRVDESFSLKPAREQAAYADLLVVDARLEGLDQRLRKLGETIATSISLNKWRKRLGIENDAWWWQFESPTQVDGWNRFDWCWDALTFGTLALSASFIVSIISALSVGSLTVATTLSAIAQVGGLALVGQGALTKDGQQKVREFMARFNIPARFRSEVMLLLAVSLLGTVFVTHRTLDDHYLEEGRQAYLEGNLSEAELTFLRGLEIEPDNWAYNTALGRIYESLGVLDKAITQYYLSVQSGGVRSINDLGRTYINWINPVTRKNDPTLAESYLMLGLQRAAVDETQDADLQYQLNRNLGWALLKQQKYDEAAHYLETAIALDQRIPGNQIGGGMAYCFLAYVYENQQRTAMATEKWGQCMAKARPETIHEYKWFSEIKKDAIAACINTSGIVSGLDEQRFVSAFQQKCVGTERPGWLVSAGS